MRGGSERGVADSGRVVNVVAMQPALVMLDAATNFRAIREAAALTVREGTVDLIVLPEIFDGWPAAQGHDEAASRRFVSELAGEMQAAVVGGSIGWSDEGGARRNVCFVADRDGREVGAYAKRVPFGLEQGRIVPGEAEGVFEVGGVRVGVMICGDLWRASLAAACAGRVDLLCVPARTGVATEGYTEYARMLWWNLALTRAMENGVAVAVADWAIGPQELPGHPHWTSGGASTVDPSARPDVVRLQRRIEGGAAGAVRAAIDLDAMAKFRAYRQGVGLLSRDRDEE